MGHARPLQRRLRTALPSLCLAAAMLILSACSTLKAPADTSAAALSWSQRTARLTAWQQFRSDGRLSSAEMNLRGDFHWTQLDTETFELRLSGPFGAGATELRGTPDAIEVRNREGTYYTDDPERWLQQSLGWSLPIGGLRYWMLGLPAPGGAADLVFDELGRAAVLKQNGWVLTYSEYRPAGDIDLPRRFNATNGQVSLKILVDRWVAPET